jgi:hypothetical protein
MKQILKIIMLLSGLLNLSFGQGTIFQINPSIQGPYGSFTFGHPVLDFSKIFPARLKLAAMAGVYDLDLNVSLNKEHTLHLGIPWHYLKFADYSQTESGPGNIELGLQNLWSADDNHFRAIQIFAYLPTCQDENVFIGSVTDALEIQSSESKLFSLGVKFAGSKIFRNNFILNYLIGFTVLFPNEYVSTGVNPNRVKENTILFHCAIEQVVKISKINLLANFSTVLAEKGLFSEQFTHQFAFGASVSLPFVQPFFLYRYYIEKNLDDFVDGVLILAINYNLGE